MHISKNESNTKSKYQINTYDPQWLTVVKQLNLTEHVPSPYLKHYHQRAWSISKDQNKNPNTYTNIYPIQQTDEENDPKYLCTSSSEALATEPRWNTSHSVYLNNEPEKTIISKTITFGKGITRTDHNEYAGANQTQNSKTRAVSKNNYNMIMNQLYRSGYLNIISRESYPIGPNCERKGRYQTQTYDPMRAEKKRTALSNIIWHNRQYYEQQNSPCITEEKAKCRSERKTYDINVINKKLEKAFSPDISKKVSANKLITAKERMDKGGVVDWAYIVNLNKRVNKIKKNNMKVYNIAHCNKRYFWSPKLQEDSAIIIQTWWRDWYRARQAAISKIVKLQSYLRMAYVQQYLVPHMKRDKILCDWMDKIYKNLLRTVLDKIANSKKVYIDAQESDKIKYIDLLITDRLLWMKQWAFDKIHEKSRINKLVLMIHRITNMNTLIYKLNIRKNGNALIPETEYEEYEWDAVDEAGNKLVKKEPTKLRSQKKKNLGDIVHRKTVKENNLLKCNLSKWSKCSKLQQMSSLIALIQRKFKQHLTHAKCSKLRRALQYNLLKFPFDKVRQEANRRTWIKALQVIRNSQLRKLHWSFWSVLNYAEYNHLVLSTSATIIQHKFWNAFPMVKRKRKQRLEIELRREKEKNKSAFVIQALFRRKWETRNQFSFLKMKELFIEWFRIFQFKSFTKEFVNAYKSKGE